MSMEQFMNRVLIWDLPTRIFHWLLSGGFFASAAISLLLGDDSPIFPYHAIIGLVIAATVVLRIVWGVIGTRYARFGSFLFGPGAVIEYMKGVLTGSGKRHLGHNPGSSYAIFAMLALVLALAVTGWLMSQGNESIKEVHEILAYATLAVIGAHVLGVIVHTMRYRENLTASMIVGTKSAEQSAAISSSQPVVAVLFLLVTGAWAYGLLSNYDAATKTTRVPLLGTSLQLGENEGNESETHSPRVAGEKEDDND